MHNLQGKGERQKHIWEKVIQNRVLGNIFQGHRNRRPLFWTITVSINSQIFNEFRRRPHGFGTWKKLLRRLTYYLNATRNKKISESCTQRHTSFDEVGRHARATCSSPDQKGTKIHRRVILKLRKRLEAWHCFTRMRTSTGKYSWDECKRRKACIIAVAWRRDEIITVS